MGDFNGNKMKNRLIRWIRKWFDENGKDCTAVIGISGGKDSTIVAALCAEALGPERVIGVAIPDEGQSINDADKICEYLGIRYMHVPIENITYEFRNIDVVFSEQALQNIPPRIRMSVLYAIAQTYNGRVIGTCNASEMFIGYFTKYGDGGSDVEPIANLTVRQVKEVGYALGLPKEWVDKTPDDGLPFSEPDDEKFKKRGYSYELIDKFLEEGTSGDEIADNAIKKAHKQNQFKLHMPLKPRF